MEEIESVGFNRKRAEGRDKSDKPKTLHLKACKLNPINSICYVQGLQRFCTEHKIKLSKIDHIFLSRVCSETAGGLPGLLLTLAGMGEEGMSVKVWGSSDLKYLVDAMKSFIPNSAMVHISSFGPAPDSDGVGICDPRKFDDPFVLVDDEVVKISALLLRPSCSEVDELMKEEPIPLNASEFCLEERRDRFLECLLQKIPNRKAELALKPGDISVINVCELPEIKGKFDPKKAAALGLRPGPKYRELQLGNSVKSDHQNSMVHPSDVLGPSVPGPIVLLVDCPTSFHLQKLFSLQSLGSYYTDTSGNPMESSKTVNCVIHLSPASVIHTSDYQKWMSRFGGAQHVMAGHEMKNIEVPILKSSAIIVAQLNYLCPQFFPAPGFWSLQQLKCSASGSTVSSESPVSKLCERICAENLLRSDIPTIVPPAEIVDELLSDIPDIVDAAQQIAWLWHEGKETKEEMASRQDTKVMIEEPRLNENAIPSCLKDITREDMEIVLLGTGSSQPSKYRNVSSIFVNLFSKGSLLLDCGKGTLGQLKRRFGIEGADDAVRGLRCIWISHIHADHHTGLARLLALRRDLWQLKRFLDAYERLEDLDMQFIDCWHATEASLDAFESNQDQSTPGVPPNFESSNENTVGLMNQPIDTTYFVKGSHMQSYWKRPGSPVDNGLAFPVLRNLKKVLGEAGLEAMISFPVVHCPQAFGVVLKAAHRVNSAGKTIAGWKIVYSGDTRPCPELVKASCGATVLIHEATFEDGLLEGIAKNHCTTKEAIAVGDSAGAYRIILTHFSQRYPKIPVFDEAHMHKTCIAFDMMSVNLADLHVLPKVLPHLKLLFRDEIIVDESEDIESVETAAG